MGAVMGHDAESRAVLDALAACRTASSILTRRGSTGGDANGNGQKRVPVGRVSGTLGADGEACAVLGCHRAGALQLLLLGSSGTKEAQSSEKGERLHDECCWRYSGRI